MSHYIFAVIFCAVLSLWILQPWIRKEVQALAEIINPLQVLKVLISAKQNTASILLRARRGDQSEIHSLWNWFAKPASKPLHTLDFFFPAKKVDNAIMSCLACNTVPRATLMQFKDCSQTRPVSWDGHGSCVCLTKWSLDNMNLDNTLEICEGVHNAVLVGNAGNHPHGCCTRVLGVMIISQLPDCLGCPEVCGICPLTPTGRLRWLVFAGVIWHLKKYFRNCPIIAGISNLCNLSN